MTTSDIGSASRRALMTLVNSLSSAGGLTLSPIDDVETVEERLAARLIGRLGLVPPINVHRIASTYATVTLKRFPVQIDGLCLDIKKPGVRPKIWVSKDISWVRQRFTLAHEIGHIIIPWHKGTIPDDLDAPRGGYRDAYRRMEAEANRFAAELLMPTSWVKETSKRAEHAMGLMNTILQVAEVSHQAAWIRVERHGPPGFIGAIVRDGKIVSSRRTPGTRAKPLREGTRFDEADLQITELARSLTNGETEYHWWKIRDEIGVPPAPAEPWRDLLDTMLTVVPSDQRALIRSRVNAVAGVAIGRLPKGSRVEEIYQRALEAFANRQDRDLWLARVAAHPQFPAYLLARAYDRAGALPQ